MPYAQKICAKLLIQLGYGWSSDKLGLSLLSQARSLPLRARAAAGGEIGRVRLAFVSTIGFEHLPVWVREFRKAWPGVALELVEATGDAQLEALARHEVDAGLLLHSPGLAPPGWQRLAVFEEPLVLALPQDHRLAKKARIPLAEVLAQPLVIFPRRILPSVHDAILGLYRANGVAPIVAQEAIQMQTIVNLVWGGLGVAWVPQSVVQFQRAGVVYRGSGELIATGRRSAPSLPSCETSLVWPANAGNPALARFVAFLEQATANNALGTIAAC